MIRRIVAYDLWDHPCTYIVKDEPVEKIDVNELIAKREAWKDRYGPRRKVVRVSKPPPDSLLPF